MTSLRVPSPRIPLLVLGEGLYRQLVAALPQSAVYLFDAELRFVLADGEAMRDAGLEPGDVVGRCLHEVVGPESRTVLEPLYRAALEGRSVDVDHRGEDGERWYRVRLRPVQDDTGEVVGGLVVTDEITQQRQAERALAESNERWQRLFAVGPVGMWLAEPGPDGAVLAVNDALCELLDLDRAQVLASTKQSLVDPDEHGTQATCERRVVRRDGSVRWLSFSASLLDDPAGPRSIGHFVDITATKDAEQRLRAAVSFQDAVLAASPHVVSVYDVPARRSTWASGPLTEMLGYGLEHVQTLQDAGGLAAMFHPDDVSVFDTVIASTCSAEDGDVVEGVHRMRHADGSWRHLARRSTPFARDEHGRVQQVLSVSWDRTTESTAARELERVKAFQQAVLTTTPDTVIVLDVEGRPAWSSRDLCGLLGWTSAEIAALGERAFEQLVLPEDLAELQAREMDAWQSGDDMVVHARYRAHHRDGSTRWLSRRMTPFSRDDHDQVDQLLMIVRDVSDVVEAERRLEHAALHDALTGLPNRLLVADRLRTSLAGLGRGGQLAVLFLDLDGFKRVNDAHGHHAGDAVLREVAERLERTVRPGDTVGRMGGDEFVVLLSPVEDADLPRVVQDVGERLRSAVAAEVEHDGLLHRVSVSIGVAYARGSDDADSVLRDADTAMYRAKLAGKDRLAVFDPEQHVAAVARAWVEQDLRTALAGDGVELHFQPLVRASSGRVAGVEALVRVVGRDGTHLDAQQAVSVAEQTGLIRELGDRVLRIACAEAGTWDDDVHVAVNLSACEVAYPDLLSRVTSALHAAGLPPHRLVLELTETVLLEAARSTVRDLERLRDLGVGIAIDDFGTGYASLRYLTTLPVTCVKVDRSFTAALEDDPVSRTLVNATISLARDLGLECVVEGVETPGQLAAVGVEPHVLAQGYLLGRPAPAPR